MLQQAFGKGINEKERFSRIGSGTREIDDFLLNMREAKAGIVQSYWPTNTLRIVRLRRQTFMRITVTFRQIRYLVYLS